MPRRHEYDQKQMEEDAAWEFEPELGASTREVDLGYGSWERARAVIQSTRRAGSGRAGRPGAPRTAPRRS